jgi:hypothetical protein
MFWVGIALIVISAILLAVTDDSGISPIILGIIGIVFMGASKYRPMKRMKN